MESWLLYAILTSLSWGGYIILMKIATSEKYYGLNPAYVLLFMLVGIAVLFVGNFLLSEPSLPTSKGAVMISIAAGALWAFGIWASLRAISGGAEIAKLAPIYNTNTLIAVLLGIVFLHELPASSELLRVLLGAVLIVLGSVLVIS